MEKTLFDESSSVDINNYDSFIERLKDELCLNGEESESIIIKNINTAYEMAVDYLKNDLFYPQKEFGIATKQKFKSLAEVYKFIGRTSSQKGKMYCRLIKLVISFYNTNPELNKTIADVIQKTQDVVQGKMMPGLQITQNFENGFSGIVAIDNGVGGYKIIPFRFFSRVKSQKSIVSKEVRDPKYFLLERLSDIYGGKFLLKSKDDILMFSQYIAGIVFKRGIYDVKDRGMFEDEEIENSTDLHKDFKKKCLSRSRDKKAISSDSMRDWRLVSPFKKDDEIKNLSLEIGFGVDDGRNDEGLASQKIYSYGRKIDEIIRLDQYISAEHIDEIAQRCVESLDPALKKQVFIELRDKFGLIGTGLNEENPHVIANIDTFIFPALAQYFIQKSGIIRIRKKQWNSNRVMYSNERQIDIHRFPVIQE